MSLETAAQPEGTSRPAPQRARGRYAPLDGVRALAICAVLAFHTDGRWLSGGFLGVDVFFVLSGYLMIGILLPGSGTGLSMPVTQFWLRRARRLAPALLVVVASVVLVNHFLASPFPDLGSDALAAVFYVTNWWALANGSQYFDQWQPPSPLLQTWSLSIEEQFYLLLPLLLLALRRLRASRGTTVVVFAVLAAVSAGWAMVLHSEDPLRVYFGSDTRAQALFVGVVLGLLAPRPRVAGLGPASTPRQFTGWFSLVGLILLLVMARPWTQEMPAWILTLTALLTAALLWALLQSESSLLARMFSHPWLLWIGGISYALYLWHWPVFLWIQARRETPIGAQVWAILVSVLLAWLTTRFLERPIRGPRFAALPVPRQWLTIALAISLTIALALLPSPGSARGPDESQWPAEQNLPSSIALFGDSTAYTAANGFPQDRYSRVRYLTMTPLGCGIRNRRLEREDLDAAKPECDGWEARWTSKMSEFKPESTILMENVWELFDVVRDGQSYAPGSPEYNDVVSAAVAKTLDIITPRDGGPVFVLGVPCQEPVVEMYQGVLDDAGRRQALNAILRGEIAKRPNAHFIDLEPLLCSPTGSLNEINGVQLRHDGVHWSEQGRPYLWAYILQQMSEVVTSSR